ncbi:hypothetical protein [Enterococcus sp. AZ109]|uniref:hypothetical protein n=1 Tax=Enterococcus sp. AZ109 TaxID=2774634 RepID=UPI003F28F5D3
MKKWLPRVFACLFLSIFVLLNVTSVGYAAQETEENKNSMTGNVGFYEEETTSITNEDSKGSDQSPISRGETKDNRRLPQTGSILKWSTVGLGLGVLAFCIMLYLTKLVRHLMFYYKKK